MNKNCDLRHHRRSTASFDDLPILEPELQGIRINPQVQLEREGGQRSILGFLLLKLSENI